MSTTQNNKKIKPRIHDVDIYQYNNKNQIFRVEYQKKKNLIFENIIPNKSNVGNERIT